VRVSQNLGRCGTQAQHRIGNTDAGTRLLLGRRWSRSTEGPSVAWGRWSGLLCAGPGLRWQVGPGEAAAGIAGADG